MNQRLLSVIPSTVHTVSLGVFLSVSVVFLAGCGPAAPPQATTKDQRPLVRPAEFSVALEQPDCVAEPPLVPRAPHDGPLFERLPPAETGIDFVNPLDGDHPLRRLYHSGFVCGGVAIGDVNGDGRPDVFLSSGPRSNKLYLQTAPWQFRDATVTAGLSSSTEDLWSSGSVLVDVDNDGDLDLYVCNYDHENQLYENQGDGEFVLRQGTGLEVSDASLMASFCDYDRDGDLDCYLLTNRYYREGGRPESPPAVMQNGVPTVLPEFEQYYRITRERGSHFNIEEYGRPDRLLKNNGDGTFVDVTQEAGIRGDGHGLSVAWWDFDNDGWSDVYIGNDFNDPDYLWRNNGDGTFTNVIAEVAPHTTWFSMGSDVADVNNDGRLDFFSVDMSATNHFKQKTTMGEMNAASIARVAGPPQQIMRNTLLINGGVQRFLEATYLAGIADSDWSWTPRFADFDNDGKVDLYITNGMARKFTDSDIKFTPDKKIGQTAWDFYANTPPNPDQNLAFRNLGDLEFSDVSAAWGLDHYGMSCAAAAGDLDGDGDLDLVVANLDEPVSLLRNNGSEGHCLVVRLQGRESNRYGVGAVLTAQVRFDDESVTLVRSVNPYTGFLASGQPLVHFGLGTATTVERLTVRWPSGAEQTLEQLAADQAYTIREANGGTKADTHVDQAASRPLFAASHTVDGIVHRETPFDDFAVQPLLPNQLSQLGPGLAVVDFDHDGDDDFYLGGAAGHVGRLFLREGDRFIEAHNPRSDIELLFQSETESEDMGCLFFDADLDGDPDLYVVSGGVESIGNDDLLRDRLYVNDGHGYLGLATDALPDLRDSGSCVTAADFDRDGDLDLFVGGRVIPGMYPLTPNSRLLRNDSSPGSPRFRDVTDELAAGLRETGLVTSALWTDVDDDGWLDLLVTHEWGPVKLYRNRQGRLVDETEKAGLAERKGWFNGIAGGDLDNDGDIDYVVTNFGLNTKYHASPQLPALLYYGDFEQKGEMQLVEAEHEHDALFPIRGKSCSTKAMPSLAEKFPTYEEFALASLEDIYTPECLQTSYRFEADTLESGVLLNAGEGHFTFRPLPRLAQISPGFGVVVAELNGDGVADLVMAQNFFTPQPETGDMDGGLSLALLGKGDGTFRPLWPGESGLIVPADAKALATMDLNQDDLPDVLIATNDGPLIAFQHQGEANRRLRVRLMGPAGNPPAIGAKITMITKGGFQLTAEVYAGGSYLAQSSAAISFAMPADDVASEVRVRWPDGSATIVVPQGPTLDVVFEPATAIR